MHFIILVDTHCHINSEEFSHNLLEVLSRALHSGVRRILVVGADVESSRKAILLTRQNSGVQLNASVGIHPHDSVDLTEMSKRAVLQMAKDRAVLAIGETGLDYHYEHSPRKEQKESFLWHLKLAHEVRKPVIVHVREAYPDTIDMLSFLKDPVRGVIHCFSGTWEDARKFLDMGFFLSFAGPVTFRKNDELREIVRKIPINRILCETDAPFLAPHPKRGTTNEPSYVKYVYEVIAQVKGITTEDLSKQVWLNSCELFGWE